MLLLFASTSTFAAKPAPAPVLPVVTASPMAALPGVTTEVTFSVDGSGKPQALWTSFPAEVSGGESRSGKIVYRLKVPGETQAGIGAVRLLTTSGAASLTFFMVDDLPTLPRQAAKHEAADARPVPEAGAVEGACEPLASDFYVIEGKRGRRVSVEIVANRLGSKLDPTVRLLGPDGREVAFCDDFPGLGPDCMLSHTFEADGKYVIEVRDANYQGGSQYFYRMRVGDFPLVTCAFPAAAGRKADGATFSFEGARGERIEKGGFALPELARVPVGIRYPNGMGSGLASLLVCDTPDFLAPGPNHSSASAARLSLPAGISGHFQTPGQKDYYAFDAKRGDRVLVRAQTRSIGSACELDVAVTDDHGKKLPEVKPPVDAKKAAADATATAPPFLDEPSLDVEIPADGPYRLVARDLGNAGGPGMVYRLVFERNPGFSLSASADKLDVPADGNARMKVNCLRRGFNGRIRLSIKDASGWKAGEAFIEPGKTDGEIEIKPDPAVPERSPNLRIIGTATIDGIETTHTATTAAAVQKVYPRMRFIPADLDGLIGVGSVSR